MLHRALAATAMAAPLAAGLVLVTAMPAAAADPREVRFSSLCGAVRVDWGPDGRVIGDPGLGRTLVLRNGAVVEEFDMGPRGNHQIGAAPGDIVELRWPDIGQSRDYRYLVRRDCDNPPRLRVTPQHDCFRAELKLENSGSTPIEGFAVASPEPPRQHPISIPPGSSYRYLPLSDGDRYGLRATLPDGSYALWLAATYRLPDGCDRDHITVQVDDACQGVQVRVANGADGAIVLAVGAEGRGNFYHRNVPARTTHTFVVPVETGTVLRLRDVTGNLDFGGHTVGEASCATPTPSGGADPTSAPSVEPTAGGPGGGGGLPVTGVQTAALAGGGAMLAAAGVTLLMIVRRRRLRFTAPGVDR
ncbi:hypothetical protein [Micromonospora deserti]|uniref:hypothetical protein n=1 Tax=Micromonospora deserti TaxID=2070366 RepID=UPI0013149701|nr:hypothetical protein [Micromonospora deserti]